jgi:hypothetical protein
MFAVVASVLLLGLLVLLLLQLGKLLLALDLANSSSEHIKTTQKPDREANEMHHYDFQEFTYLLDFTFLLVQAAPPIFLLLLRVFLLPLLLLFGLTLLLGLFR